MMFVPQNDYAKAFCLIYGTELKAANAGADVVSSAVLKTVTELVDSNKYPATNKPAGDEQQPNYVTSPARTTAPDLQNFLTKCPTPSKNFVLLGETHNNPADTARATAALAAIPATLTVDLTFFERGMTYVPTAGANFAREENLFQSPIDPNFWQGFSVTQRSMVVAGYLAIYAGSGPQNTKDSFLVIFGEEHSDIFKDIEYCIRHTSLVHMAKQPRNYNLVKSSVK